MKKNSGIRRWGPAAGVLAVGLMAFSLTLEGAAPSPQPQPQVMKQRSVDPEAPVLIEGSDVLPAADPAKVTGPIRSGHVTSVPSMDTDRLPEGIKFGRVEPGGLPVMPAMTVDYRDDIGTRMRNEGKLVGPYRPWKVGGEGGVAAGGCSFDIQCDDCNPCTQDVCQISVGAPLGSGTCINSALANGAEGGCSDGLCCNGRETCQNGVCEAPGAGTGTFDPNACQFPCSGGNVCNEDTNLCRLPCTGASTCSISGGACQSTQDCPTGPGLTGNYCLNCQDGVNCNGVETCVSGICQAGTNPCGPGGICGERDCSGAGTTVCTTDSDCAALQLGTCTRPGPICFPGRCCNPAATPEAGCSKRFKNSGSCTGGSNAGGACVSNAQCRTCTVGPRIGNPCTSNAECGTGGTCGAAGTCNLAQSCDTVGGRWYSTDDGQLPLTGGLVCPTPQQENPANDRTLCPKYSSGVAPLVNFSTEQAFVVGFFSQGPCDQDSIGDDYEFTNNAPVAMEIFRWIGGGGGRLLVEFYDENGNFIEDVITGGVGGGNAVRSLNFLPPLTLPGRGFFSISVATNFAPNGQTFVTATDAVDEGINKPSGTGSLWFNGAPSSIQLRECVGGTNDGAWCNPADPGDSDCVGGGGVCQNRNNILAFEIEGLKVPLPTGACCISGGCTPGLAPWVCTGGGGVYQGNDSTCPANCNTGACCTSGNCNVTTPGACSGTFRGAGTDCEPNCCLQTFTGADNCQGVTVHNVSVPAPGDDPVVVTISGNNAGATGPDTCLQGAWNAAGGTYLTVDAGWWEAVRIDSCAFVRVDFCCSDPVVEPQWALIWTGCPCQDAIFTAVNPNNPSLPANRRGGPYCEDDNLWNQFGPLPGGTCTGGTNPGSACVDNSQCSGGNTCTPGRTYYIPIYSVPPGANDAYQMHITVEACPVAACCDGTTCVETDQLGCAAIDGANFLAPPFRTQATTVCSGATCTTGSCCYIPGQGLCQDIASGQLMTEALCNASNGIFKGGARCLGCVCEDGSPPESCDADEDCSGANGPCNNPQGGPCSGQNQTQPSPCPVCDFESTSRCQRQPGYDGARLSDICAGDCVSDPPSSEYSLPGIRAADDFVASVGGNINAVCVWGIWFDQNAGGADCSASEVVEKFTVTIYNDLNGVPGTIVGDRRSTTVVRKARTFTSGTRHIFQWQLALSAPIPVVQGNTYWLEVVNNTDESTGLPGCDWMWALSDPDQGSDSGNKLILQDFGNTYTFADARFDGADLAWCIDLENTVPVLPEAACCTCGGGVGTCAVRRLEDCVNSDGQWHSTEPDCIGVVCPNTGPSNDNCATKTVVSTNSDTPWANYCTNTDGPASAGNSGCSAGLDYQNDLWYAWTAPENCEVVIETCDLGGEIDTAVLVYSNNNATCPCPTSAANETQCDDDGCVFVGAGSRITMQATAGVCYTIRVTSFLGEKGSGVLHISDCTVGSNPPPTPVADPAGEKVRFISFSAPGTSQESALRIRLNTLHAVSPAYTAAPTIPFTAFQGLSVWVGPPATWVEAAATPGATFKSAVTQCTPHYRDWTSEGLIHVRGSAIVPSSSYAVENVAAACQGNEGSAACLSGGANVSGQLIIGTRRWGDIETPFNPPSTTTQPDLADVSAMVNKFRGAPGAPIKARAIIAPNDPFGNINDATMAVDFGFTHISLCVDAFRGARYPGQMGRCSGAGTAACTTASDCNSGGNVGPCNLYCP